MACIQTFTYWMEFWCVATTSCEMYFVQVLLKLENSADMISITYSFSIILHQDTCEPVCFKLCMMLLCMTLMFTLGHRVMEKPEFVQLHQAPQILMMVYYVREMTVKKVLYGVYASYEHLLFLLSDLFSKLGKPKVLFGLNSLASFPMRQTWYFR